MNVCTSTRLALHPNIAMNMQDRHQADDALRDCLLARLKEKGEELRALLAKMERDGSTQAI